MHSQHHHLDQRKHQFRVIQNIVVSAGWHEEVPHRPSARTEPAQEPDGRRHAQLPPHKASRSLVGCPKVCSSFGLRDANLNATCRRSEGDRIPEGIASAQLATMVRAPPSWRLCGAGTHRLAGIIGIDLFRRTSITESDHQRPLPRAHQARDGGARVRDEPRVTDAERCWYEHSYVDEASGEAWPGPGTRSMCALLAADPGAAHLVGWPTHFLSHAWLYKVLDVVAALQEFVASLPAGEPEHSSGSTRSPSMST